eukprot:jgi/Mesen1/1104/ME000123S00271
MASLAKDHLQDERSPQLFDVRRMTFALYGGQEAAEQSERFANIVANDPIFSKSDRPYLPRVQLVKRALEKSKRVIEKRLELSLSGAGAADEELYTMWRFVDEVMPIGLNLGMFIPALEQQGTDEQQARWLPLARSFSIIGCYAQTEMGHGSNVQGLETVAEYDPGREEFEIHSPTITSTKWWPGGLGKAATHALVYARLITLGKACGIHAFLVPLRSLETHEPLPGVTVGDMGPKFGYNTMDNGLLRLDRVRVPRDHMLMRYAQVSKEGQFRRNGHAKIAYGAMAVTITVRYSAVRRQFGPPQGPETKILDYKTQQHALLPLLATAYAFLFVGRWMMRLYRDTAPRLAAGDYSTLPEVHACTAGLKALTTTATADGIEECRRRCGGNGYLHASGLPELYASYVPAVTFEGDNTILFLQVARYLVKAAGQAGKGERLTGTAEYLNDWRQLSSQPCSATCRQDLLDPRVQRQAYAARAARLVFACAQRLSQAPEPNSAFEAEAVSLVRAARAHCQLIAVTNFAEEATRGLEQELAERGGVARQLKMLSDLYCLALLQFHLGDFLEAKCVTAEQAAWVHEQVQLLLTQVRPSAVQLVDAFNFTDHYLGSALGRYDGDVYTHLYASAWRDPLNATPVVEGIEYLRPFLGQPPPSEIADQPARADKASPVTSNPSVQYAAPTGTQSRL